MAKTRSKNHGRSKSATKILKKKAGKKVADTDQFKMLEQVTEIEPLIVSEEDDLVLKDVFQSPLSPKSSLEAIQRQVDVRTDFVQFLKANDQCNSNLQQALVYHLWKARNAVIWQKALVESGRIIEAVKWTTKTRVYVHA
uniref:Uncharacterized protein n=1 Tax=Cannabis sativa TaxID=3483 RepID=A0A803Q727_CANSA